MEDDMQAAIEGHEKEWHYAVPAESIGGMVTVFEEMQEQRAADHGLLLSMSTAIQGEPSHDFEGNVVGHEGGMQADITVLMERTNGGGVLRMKTRDKLLIIAANGVVVFVVAYLATL